MKYTTRYIEFPVILIYGFDRENELDENMMPIAETLFVNSFARLNPLQFEGYSPDTDGGIPSTEESLICTRVYMKSGAEHIINMPINEFEAYLDEVYAKIHDQPE